MPVLTENREEVDQKWEDLLTYEAEIMKNLGKKETHSRLTSFPIAFYSIRTVQIVNVL